MASEICIEQSIFETIHWSSCRSAQKTLIACGTFEHQQLRRERANWMMSLVCGPEIAHLIDACDFTWLPLNNLLPPNNLRPFFLQRAWIGERGKAQATNLEHSNKFRKQQQIQDTDKLGAFYKQNLIGLVALRLLCRTQSCCLSLSSQHPT